MKIHQFDVLVVGAGGAGLMAALYASKTANTAVLEQALSHPLAHRRGPGRRGRGPGQPGRRPSGMAHLRYGQRQRLPGRPGCDRVHVLRGRPGGLRAGAHGPALLAHAGWAIAQRPFGGHTNNVTGKPVRRACYAADRTGHMILQTLYQQCIKNKVNFFDEFQVVDLILVERRGRRGGGARAGDRRAAHLPRQGGHLCHRRARAHLGDHLQCLCLHRRRRGRYPAARHPGRGYGVLPVPSHRHLQAGHPDHRGGARRRRRPGQRQGRALHGASMPPTSKTWPRAMWSAGRCTWRCAKGAASTASATCTWMCAPKRSTSTPRWMGARRPDGSPYVVTGEELLAKLPDIVDFCRTYLGVDPVTQPMPVQPTAHYAMGGIPTNKYRRGGDR